MQVATDADDELTGNAGRAGNDPGPKLPAGRGGRGGTVVAAAVLLALVLALKATSFGDTNGATDPNFYFLVGQRMHDGLTPYVDVWDRKPLGLFLIYYLIAGVSASVLAYQIVACLFAAATALVVRRIAMTRTGPFGGLAAGIAYLLTIVPLEGASGQAPDFYNLLMALAALAIIREMDSLAAGRVRWRIFAAMALCGVAITVKQTALFESAFLGIYVLAVLRRAGASMSQLANVAATCMAIGAAPMLLIAAWYGQAGHWYEFWHAMVTSNLAKAVPGRTMFHIGTILVREALMGPLALLGVLVATPDRRSRVFMSCWLAAAFAGFLSVPNFFAHYLLPMAVPLAVAAGLLFGNARRGLLLFAAFAVYASLWVRPGDPAATRASIARMEHAAREIRRHDPGGGLLVYDAPAYLYALTGERFLSPLVFPHHLSSALEQNVSHLPTNAEFDRILAGQPGVIVMARYPLNTPANRYTRSRALAYARENCATVEEFDIAYPLAPVQFVLFGDCIAGAGRSRPDRQSGS